MKKNTIPMYGLVMRNAAKTITTPSVGGGMILQIVNMKISPGWIFRRESAVENRASWQHWMPCVLCDTGQNSRSGVTQFSADCRPVSGTTYTQCIYDRKCECKEKSFWLCPGGGVRVEEEETYLAGCVLSPSLVIFLLVIHFLPDVLHTGKQCPSLYFYIYSTVLLNLFA
jgi:hypothetical protein